MCVAIVVSMQLPRSGVMNVWGVVFMEQIKNAIHVTPDGQVPSPLRVLMHVRPVVGKISGLWDLMENVMHVGMRSMRG